MAAQYHSLFTTQGLALLREAIQTGAKLGITHMAYGDGNGIVPTPNADFTKLVREVYRTPLNRLSPSKENSNWLEADGVIPSAVGGFNIREVGLYAGNVLVAYANYPATYKPSSDQGTAQIKTIRIVLQIDNTANFELKIDASVVMATIQAVEDAKTEIYKNTTTILDSIFDITDIAQSEGKIVNVKSLYKDVVSGGGDFIFSTETNLTAKAGFIINVEGGCWKRILKTSHSIEDAGAHPTQSRAVNTLAINTALEMSKDVFVPTATYQISPTGIYLNTGNYLHGKGVFVGDAPDTIAADGTGTYLVGAGVNNVEIEGITLKNGYRGTGIIFYDAKDIVIRNVTVDGFTYGITLREKNFQEQDTNGVQDALLENIVIKNTRYWGIYLRCFGTTTQAKKTQRIKVLNPYFYNCHMAGYVEAEGNVRYTVLENPVFERCNVCMHYELSSDFTIINPRTIDTGKKSDQLPSNNEYPFRDWSLYLCFVERGQVIGGNLDSEVNLLGTANGKVADIAFLNVHARSYAFEGIDGNSSQDNYSNISWIGGSVTGTLIYQKAGTSYLRDINIDGVFSKMNGDNNGNAISINAVRCVNMTVKNCTFTNSALKVAIKGFCHILNNKWIVGTDNTNNSFDGTNGDLSGNFLDFSGNTFTRAGGVVYGKSANFIANWTRARIDNVIRGNNIEYAYEFKNNYRVEMGGSLIYDTTVSMYTDEGTQSFVKLYV